jgi:hypothetical protein
MKIASTLAGVCLALMSVSTAQAASITIAAAADGTVSDGNEDGTFETVNTDTSGIPVTNGKVNTPSMGVFEFDLSAPDLWGMRFLPRILPH